MSPVATTCLVACPHHLPHLLSLPSAWDQLKCLPSLELTRAKMGRWLNAFFPLMLQAIQLADVRGCNHLHSVLVEVVVLVLLVVEVVEVVLVVMVVRCCR